MDIGIIGSGNIGTAVAIRWIAQGHRVAMANSRGPDSLQDKAKEIGIIPAELREAARAADIVVVTVPLKAIATFPKDLFAGTGSIILDTCNYYPDIRDGRIAAIDEGLTESAWVSQQLGRGVLKIFNSIHAPTIVKGGLAAGDPKRICLPVAGDDDGQKRTIIEMCDAIGFDGLDAGTLAESWRQQPGTPVYCRDLPLPAARAALAEADHALVATYRKQTIDKALNYARNAQRPGDL
jgi:8-hydroxy-5-deazaflavin:NADPH oxidoreductase